MSTPTLADLSCLNTWPEGSFGHIKERQALAQLLILCETHGFGRIPQLAAEIEMIWRNGEKQTEVFQKRKEKQMAFMTHCRKEAGLT